jgi:hypothetical protein
MRALCTALACALIFAAAASDAAAEMFEVINGELGLRATWRSFEFEANGLVVRCPLTLEGTFAAESISTTPRAAVATITSAALPSTGCTGGTASVSTETLPWHVQYASFTGVLPTITSVRLRAVDAGFSVQLGGTTCRARATEVEPVNLVANIGSEGVTSLEAEPTAGIRLEGNALCPFFGLGHVHGAGSLKTQLGEQIINIIQGPRDNGPWVVAVGDSYISGEAGRWASNTSTLPEARIDHGQRRAYFDNFDHTGEQIPFCHRHIRGSEIQIGQNGGPRSLNLACTGAMTTTVTSDAEGHFKPGLDFPDTGPSQLTELRLFAAGHRNQIRLVAVSIGGNDFHFGDVVRYCMRDFIAATYCRNDTRANQWFTPISQFSRKLAIKRAIENVHKAMWDAGYQDDTAYKILVQGYENVLPANNTGTSFRYPETNTRRTTGGCAIYNTDAMWAATTVLPAINDTIRAAVAEITLFNNIVQLDLTNAFVGHRLCERYDVLPLAGSVGLLEENGFTWWWNDPLVMDLSEWVNQIRIENSNELMWQESLHPNAWGQRALRSCLRQAYNNGAPRGGTCTIQGPRMTALSEPRMVLNP